MPLSEHEQRLLDQIERALYAEDPKFASTVRTSDLRTHQRKRAVRYVIGFAVGLAVLLAGLVAKILPISIIGFLIMFASTVAGITGWQRTQAGPRSDQAEAPRKAKSAKVKRMGQGPSDSSLSAHRSPVRRLEDRWRRRWDDRSR